MAAYGFPYIIPAIVIRDIIISILLKIVCLIGWFYDGRYTKGLLEVFNPHCPDIITDKTCGMLVIINSKLIAHWRLMRVKPLII